MAMAHTVSWMVDSTKEVGKMGNRRGKQISPRAKGHHYILQFWDTHLARWGFVCRRLGGRGASGLGSLLLEQRKLLPGESSIPILLLPPQGRVVANVMEGQALHFRWGDGAKFQCAELKDCFRQGSIGRWGGM